jgi:tetratricopeptide (TPR) repeat protein
LVNVCFFHAAAQIECVGRFVLCITMTSSETIANKINSLIHTGAFASARKVISNELDKLAVLDTELKILAASRLYGHLIDLGCEGYNEHDLTTAIAFLQKHQSLLSYGERKPYYYYNLANASDGLGRAFYYANRGIHSLDTQKQRFQESIQYYWTAFNSVSNDTFLRLQIAVNLSNSLIVVGRIVEAIQFQDEVLKVDRNFPQALISRADHLTVLSERTNCMVSIRLFRQIAADYEAGISTGQLPAGVLERARLQKENTLTAIEKRGFRRHETVKEALESRLEFEQHTAYRKFCILKHLTLNEHGLYCGCVANEKDDIQIGVKHGVFRSEVLPKLELLLNRLKSEFGLARWLYHNAINQNAPLEFDVQFSDLLENEILTPSMELQRSAFRICYGILDKIALGICKLYNIPVRHLLFESFWRDAAVRPVLNQTRNLHLNALYSIACDLNTTSGELKHFKNWRNKLEHHLLIIKDTLTIDQDYLKVFEDQDFVAVIDENEFRDKTLHLLQLTRAAIFSYVFCVRLHIIERPTDENNGRGFPINLK